MSVYVISDLHGCLEEFRTMLDKIQFSEYDELYIAGDVCDRGRYPIELLRLIMANKNMHLIFGNHDVWLARYAEDLIEGKRNPGHLRLLGGDFLNWVHWNGGLVTIDQFLDSDFTVCYDILDYLSDPQFYKELQVAGRKFLIVHSGLGERWKLGLPVCEYSESELIWPHIGLNDNPYRDVTMIVGHMPTFLYGKQYEGKIIHGRNLLHIDCGCVFGRSLGCVRLDDMQEFYVSSSYPYLE